MVFYLYDMGPDGRYFEPSQGLLLKYSGSSGIVEVLSLFKTEESDKFYKMVIRNADNSIRTIHLYVRFEIVPARRYRSAMDFTMEEMVKCEDCGAYVNSSDLMTAYDDRENSRRVCEKCLEENYFECEDCEKWHTKNNISVFDVGDKKVCSFCADENYFGCDECGEYRAREDLISGPDGRWYCQECYEDTFIACNRCGNTIRACSSYSSEDYDNLCEDCYDEFERESAYIYAHGTKLECRFHDDRVQSGIQSDREKIPGVMYYGMELELECCEHMGKKEESAEEVYDPSREDWYLEEDGSLDYGFEVIFHARTFESWQEFWDSVEKCVLSPARKMSCEGENNTCGIHIHSSIDAWESDQLFRLFSLIYSSENYENILIISQRNKGQLDHWASLSIDNIGQFKEEIRKKYSPFDDRYAALNITRNTLEFRIFRSSLDLCIVQKNLEFVYALYEYTKSVKTSVTWHGLMLWIKRNKETVPRLYDFCISRGLIKQKKEAA